jgi:hypothetical protein
VTVFKLHHINNTAIMIAEQFEEVLKKTSQLFPTVTPGQEDIYQLSGDAGNKTLWVVFVLMLIASAAFTAMSWKIPVVRNPDCTHL